MKKKYFGLIIAGLLVLTGCGKEKEVKGINDYETVCGNNNYQIIDRMERYVNDSYITNSKACVLDNGEIEMVQYDNETSAKEAQDKQIGQFKNYKSTGNIIKASKGKNYYKYTMVSNGYYMVSSRIDNTLIFTKIKLDDKDNIDKILEDMGY